MRHLFAVFLLIAFAGCDQNKPATKRADTNLPDAAAGPAKVLARVNGVPITEIDVKLRGRTPPAHGGAAPAAPTPSGVLETVIRDELVYQRAVELGLDRDPEYMKKLQEMEAGIAAFKRREMLELFNRRELAAKAAVSDDEAKAYFEKHAGDVKSEYHVMQILISRDETAARATKAEIAKGASFEEVAKKRFPGLPETVKPPWDLGYLKWNQIPEAWWGVIFQMKPGQVSDVIAGEQGRFWILKLVDRREVQGASFEQVKPRIVSVLERQKLEKARTAILEELRKKADVVYSSPAPKSSGE